MFKTFELTLINVNELDAKPMNLWRSSLQRGSTVPQNYCYCLYLSVLQLVQNKFLTCAPYDTF